MRQSDQQTRPISMLLPLHTLEWIIRQGQKAFVNGDSTMARKMLMELEAQDKDWIAELEARSE